MPLSEPSSESGPVVDANTAGCTKMTPLFRGRLYPLFNPRKQSWKRHFVWGTTILVGKTITGKVTIQVLNINEESRVNLRETLLFEGRFPPEE
jgi:hypothetical protein